jgi:hypothetical protein
VFVALAGIGGTPVKSKVGKEMKLPPPATAFSAPAMAPTAHNRIPWRMSKRDFYHEGAVRGEFRGVIGGRRRRSRVRNNLEIFMRRISVPGASSATEAA